MVIAGKQAQVDDRFRLWDVSLLVDKEQSITTIPFMLSRIQSPSEINTLRKKYEDSLRNAYLAIDYGDFNKALSLGKYLRNDPDYRNNKSSQKLWSKLTSVCIKKRVLDSWIVKEIELPSLLRMEYDICFDGVQLIFNNNGVINHINLADLKLTQPISISGYISTYCLSDNGSLLLLEINKHRYEIWDTRTWQCIRSISIPNNESSNSIGHGLLKISNDGNWMLIGCWILSGGLDGRIELYDTNTGSCIRVFNGFSDALSISPDFRNLIFIAWDRNVKVWDIVSGEHLYDIIIKDSPISSVKVNYIDNHLLVGVGKGAIPIKKTNNGIILDLPKEYYEKMHLHLHRLIDGQLIRSFKGNYGPLNSVSLCVDKRIGLSCGTDVRIWDLNTGECLQIFNLKDSIKKALISADANHIILFTDQSCKIMRVDWDLENKAPTNYRDDIESFIKVFLSCHTPYKSKLPKDRKAFDDEIRLALTRKGKPLWTDEDFKQLIYELGCAGYGWLSPEGVKRKLVKMAANWDGSPPLPIGE